ncbi:hypothetical protein ACWENR_10085 [Micromonospora sp. NPDC004336]
MIITAVGAAAVGAWTNIATSKPTAVASAGLVAALLIQCVAQFLIARSEQTVAPPAEIEPVRPSASELLMQMDKEATVRLRERWQALQLSDETVNKLQEVAPSLFSDLNLPSEGVVLVTAELGTGKSTYADILHRNMIQDAYSGRSDFWPVFLDARSLERVPLAEAVKELLPPVPPRQYAVIVDGCDELARDAANRLLRESRLLVGSNAGSLVALFCRPGYLTWRDEITLPELGNESAELLMEVASGQELRVWRLPVELRKIVGRPLFAILAARYFSDLRRGPTTEAALLRALVEDVIRRDGAPDEIVFSQLRRLASQTITHGGQVPDSEAGALDVRESLIATRLVVSHAGVVRFAAPVIEQYFAALALLRREVDHSSHLRSLAEWERWRAVWVAAMTIGSWQELQSILPDLISRHPGAAAWLVGETVPVPESGHNDASQNLQPLPQSDLEARMNLAFRAWAAAFPNIALRFGMLDGVDGRCVRIVVRSSSESGLYIAGWSGLGEPTELQVDRSRDIFSRAEPGWLFRYAANHKPVPTWPWRFTLERFGAELFGHLKRLRWSPDVPALAAEKQWDQIQVLAARVTKQAIRNKDYGAAIELLLRDVDQLLDILGEEAAGWDLVHVDRRVFEIAELRELRQFLRHADPREILTPPYPEPDLGGRVGQGWGGYSVEQLARRAEAVYRAALNGYIELAQTLMPAVVPTLGLGAILPVHMKGNVGVKEKSLPVALMKYDMFPLSAGQASRVEMTPGSLDVASGEDESQSRKKQWRLIQTYRRETAAWVGYVSGYSSLDVHLRMPATRIAIRWLADDLRQIHVVNELFPYD